jgi:hypothetical protein
MKRSLFVICTLALAACEQSTIIEGTITIDSSLAPATPAPLLVIVDGGPDATIAWNPAGLDGSDADTPYALGTLAYHYRWEEFGKPPHALFVAAFLDLDGDGKLGKGDPFGTFDRNPLVDAKWGSTAPANIADITIDSVEP